MRVTNVLMALAVAGIALLQGVLPASVAAGAQTVYYLDKTGNAFTLSKITPVSKGEREVHEQLNPFGRQDNPYKVLGTWNVRAESATRVIDLGKANLWMKADGIDNDNIQVQLKVEVLQNGVAAVTKESKCISLVHKPTSQVIVDVPTPRPPIELAAGDSLSFQVSVRHGVAISCSGGRPKGAVKLFYDGRDTPSNFGVEFAGSVPLARLIQFGDPSYIAPDDSLFISPATEIIVGVEGTLATCTLTLGFPDGSTAAIPCAGGRLSVHLRGVPDAKYTLRLTATDLVGAVREEVLEVFLDGTPPDITIGSPVNGATYTVNQVVLANYSCTDALSGVASCNGPVPSGSNILPGGPPGAKTFAVAAVDNLGNAALRSVSYTVTTP